MGILKALGDFLFGKDPDIFDNSGRVRHKLPEQKWQAWDKRIRDNQDYNWLDHTGKHLGDGPGERNKKRKTSQH